MMLLHLKVLQRQIKCVGTPYLRVYNTECQEFGIVSFENRSKIPLLKRQKHYN